MKKVININFQGQVIAIEETAYEILKQYIDSLKEYFSREEGGDEIVNDIECRIAELFGNRLKHGINCITDEDVEVIISSIGRPKDFDSDYYESSQRERGAGESSSTTGVCSDNGANLSEQVTSGESRSLNRNANDQIIGGVCSGLAHYFKTDPAWIRILFVLFFGVLFWVYIVLWIVLKSKPLESNVTKRLYRNPNDRYLSGVCGGIGAYFKIESWIPRLLFLLPIMLNVVGMVSIFPLSTFFHNIGFNWNINLGVVLLYVVLWIIIPEAKTVKQKLEMMGEDDYIQSIRDKVTDNVASAKSRTDTGRYDANTGFASSGLKIDNDQKPSSENMPPEPPRPNSRTAQYPQPDRSGCLNVLVIFLKIIFFSFVGIFALMLVVLFFGLLFAGSQFMPLKSLFIDPGYETNLLFTSIAMITLVPLISVIIWVIRRVMKVKSRPIIGVVATVLWFAGLAIMGVLATSVAKKFNVESSREEIVALSPVNSGKLYVEMETYKEDFSEFKLGYGFGLGSEIDELPYTTVNEDSLLFRKINLQIGKSSDSLFHIRTIAASRGRNLRSAKADIEQFTYNIVQKDSVLFLPEFLAVPVNQGFRDQSITIEIFVPAGKKVEVSDALREYKNNQTPSVVRKRVRTFSRTYFPVEAETSGQEFENIEKRDTV